MEGMKNSYFGMNFDACISGNIQPIDLKLKTLVDRDFNDRLCSFLCWGCRIGAVLFRHLARRATKVGFVVVSLPSWINLDRVAPSGYKSRVSLVTRWVVDVVDMSLIGCA